MKIIIAGPAYPLRGGIAHYTALLAEVLGSRHEVETITFKRQYPSILFPGKTQQETGEGPHPPPSPQLIDSINPFNWIAVGREIRRRRPDLLILRFWMPFFGPCFGTITRVAKRGTNMKMLLICDNIVPHEHRPFDGAFTRYLFRSADYFLVQSHAVEKELQAFCPGASYRMVPHPVYRIFGRAVDKDEARRTLGIRAARVMLFFGYIRAYKGVDVLIRAMASLPEDIHALVVGEFYEDEGKYRSLIRELALEDRITVHADYVPTEEVHRFFSASDVVVLPYLSATQSGIAQIAYNFDKPVIATDVGGLAEVVIDGKTGYIVPPRDPSRLAAAIRKFYGESREAEFTAHVREEKVKYSWEHMLTSIEELMRSEPTSHRAALR